MDITQLYTAKSHGEGAEMQVHDDDDDTDYDIEELVLASLGWRGFEQAGEELEFSKDNVRQLYKQAPYIKDQAIIFVHNRANFTKG